MKSAAIIILLTTAAVVVFPAPATAQTADDVVVMRRVVARPNRAPDTPAPATPQANHWETGGWTGTPSCSPAVEQTRTVTCMGSGDRQPDAACTKPKPDGVRTVADYSSCEFAWQITGHGAWSSACSNNATRTTQSTCMRSDGTIAADAQCSSVPRPADETGPNTSGCSFHWTTGQWSTYSSTCSATATREREVYCQRSDLTTADTSSRCTGTAPASRETADVAASCTYAWEYSAWTVQPACGDTTMARSASCRRSDGTAATDDKCDPTRRQTLSGTTYDTQTCGYSWSPGTWSDWSSTCSSAASRTRVETCLRSDNQPVDEGHCADLPHNALSEGPVGVFLGCGYVWVAGTFTWNSTCSASATQTRDVACHRQSDRSESAIDMGIVADDLCPAATRPAASTTPVANYAGCAYDWVYGGWGWNGTNDAVSSQCTPHAMQSRTATCYRHQSFTSPASGVVVTGSDALCAPSPPTTSRDTGGRYGGCANLVVNGSFETGDTAGWSGGTGASCVAAGTGANNTKCYGRTSKSAPLSQTVTGLEVGATYRFVMWGKGNDGSAKSWTVTLAGATPSNVAITTSANGSSNWVAGNQQAFTLVATSTSATFTVVPVTASTQFVDELTLTMVQP